MSDTPETEASSTTVTVKTSTTPVVFTFADDIVKITFEGTAHRTISRTDWEHLAAVYGRRRTR